MQGGGIIFKQVFEPVSSTYTYLLGCEETRRVILIDAVLPTWQRDLAELNQLGLKLAYTLDSHIHADHITAALKLKMEAGSRIAHRAYDRLECAGVGLEEGRQFEVGSLRVEPLFTPGHTDGHHAYRVDGRVFTGDAPTLYRSVRESCSPCPKTGWCIRLPFASNL